MRQQHSNTPSQRNAKCRNALVALCIFFLCLAGLAEEPPSLVSSFFGTVTVDGANGDQIIPIGTPVAAFIDGTEYVTSALFEGPEGISYALDVPGDLLNTPAVEGGLEGQAITFRIGAGEAQQTSLWTYGGHSRLDLTAMAGPDINVDLDDGESLASASEILTYTLTVNNPSTDPVVDVALSQEIPANGTWLSASDSGSLSDGEVIWPAFDLTAGSSTSRTVQVQLLTTFPATADYIESTARVSYDGAQGIDPEFSDNTSRDATLLDIAPDLALSIDDGVSSVAPGSMLTYALTVSNSGDQDASGVIMTVPLSVDTTFFTASDNGIESPPGMLTWPTFDLAVGQTATRTMTLRYDGSSGGGTFVQTAEVTPGNSPDQNSGDNTASDSNSVEQGVDLTPTWVDLSATSIDLQSLQISGSASITVLNDDNGPLASAFDIALFEDLDLDGTFTVGIDNVLGQQTFAAGIDAGASAVFDIPLSGIIAFRDNRLWAFVDSSEQISERFEDNNLAHSAESCQAAPVPEAFQPVIEMSWPEDDANFEWPDSDESLSTPIVVQLNDDNGDGTIDEEDRPDIVFVTDNRDNTSAIFPILRAIDGGNGNSRFATPAPVTQGINFAPTGLAAGDLDGNGSPEIIVSGLVEGGGLPNVLLSYSRNGNLRWISDGYRTHPGASVTNRDNPTLADLDGDGRSEILVGANVFDFNGNLLWTGSGGQAFQSASNNNNLDSGAISIAADLDMDGLQEVVTGNTAYRHDGSIYWQVAEDDGYPAVGNFDSDDFPEIVVVARGKIRLHEHDGTLIWGPVELPGSGDEAGGAPTVADFDADGEAEIGVAGSTQYVVFETDGSVKWQRTTQDGSSNMTGSTVFDLDGDGRFEVIYRDEAYLRIYRGEDGTVLFQDEVSSETFNEEVVVADVDGDGRAEVIVSSDRGLATDPPIEVPQRTAGLRIYGDLNDNWIGARTVWNQQAYHIDNINADGSIPAQPAFGWLTHNTYRANSTPDGVQAFAAADVTVSRLTADLSAYPTVTLSARLGNGGISLLPKNTPLAFYDGDPTVGGNLLGVLTLPQSLDPGEFADLSLDLEAPGVGEYTVYVVAADDGQGSGARRECRADNNIHSFSYDTSDLGLWLRTEDGTDAVQPGSQLTYSITLANGSPFTRSGVVISDDLPLHTNLVAASDGAVLGGDAGTGFTVTWPSIVLGAFETVQRTLTLSVDGNIPLSSSTITNTTTVSDDGAQPDPTPLNNTVVDINRVLTVRADIGGPYAGDEGADIAFDGSASSDRDGNVVAWEWDLDDDGTFDDASGVTASRSFPDEGTYAVHLRVTDDSGEQDLATTQVSISNVAATISLDATQTYNEGDAAILLASFVDGGVADTHTATIDWGDGTSDPGTVDQAAGTVTGGHDYPDNGVFDVEVCITDDDGATACATQTLTVDNVIPAVVEIGELDLNDWNSEFFGADIPDWEVNAEGSSVVQNANSSPTVFYGPFTATGVDLEGRIRVQTSADNDFIGFVLGFNPGDFSNPQADYLLIDWKKQTQVSASGHTATVGLAVSRVLGTPRSTELWAHDDNPSNGSDNRVEELQRGLTRGNVAWAEFTTYAFTFETSPTHLKVWVDGTLEIDLEGDFNFGRGRFGFYNYSQQKVRYSGFTARGEALVEGETAHIELPFSDVGLQDTHTATIDWQDGTVESATIDQVEGGGTVSGSHPYPDNGLFEVPVCVEDDDGGEGCGIVPVTVLNVPPALVLESGNLAYLDRPYDLAAAFTDEGVLDTHTATIDWGDGSPFEGGVLIESGGAGTLTASHQYTTQDVFDLRLCITDDDGGETCKSLDISTFDPRLDVAVDLLASHFAVRPGEAMSYTVRVANQGTLAATGVEVVLDLPTEIQPIGATLGGQINGQRVTWTLPSLTYLERQYLVVDGIAAASLPFGQTASATTTVTDDGSEGPDADPTNNSDNASVQLWDATTAIVEVGINLSRGDDVVLNVSTEEALYPAAESVDGDADTSWFTVCEDAVNEGGSPFFELILPREASIWGIQYQGLRSPPSGRDFLSGRFQLWDDTDHLLYDSGDIQLPEPDRDVILDIPNLLGAKRLRFTPSADQSCSPGFADLALIGVYGDAAEAHVIEGEEIHLAGLFHDTSADGPYTSTVVWGDSAQSAPTPDVLGALGVVKDDHTYIDNGTYPLEICVTDNGNLLGCSELDVIVANSTPDVNDDPQVDLSLWQTEHYVGGTQGESNWVVAADGRSVHQTINSRPSIFYGDIPVINTRLTGTIRIDNQLMSDDDFAGFVFGFQPEDTTNPNADFLLVDWKKRDQEVDDCGTGELSLQGLVASRVFGIPSLSELWDKVDYETCNAPGNGVEQLQRGLNLGDTGWEDERTYEFTFEYTETHLRVFVDGQLEIDINGDFHEGRFAFYNHSQADVHYSAFDAEALVVDEGSPIELLATFTDQGDGDTHTATIDWQDGTVTAGTIVVGELRDEVRGSHVYGDNLLADGEYPTEVCVTDDDGATGCGIFPILVFNVRPSVDAGPDITGTTGVPTPLDAPYVDPGFEDSHTSEVDWGDGSSLETVAVTVDGPGQGRVVSSHTYDALGTYVVTVCVEDDDGGRHCDSREVLINVGRPPSDIVATVTPSIEAERADLSATFSEPDGGETHTASIDWGDGSSSDSNSGLAMVTQTPGGGSVAAFHHYAENGTYTVQLCITDSGGQVSCADTTAVVSNAAPRLGRMDLGNWQQEDIEGPLAPGQWTVSPDGSHVQQDVNNDRSFFYSDDQAIGGRWQGWVRPLADNDYWGFTLGFRPGDSVDPQADYLRVHWKGDTEAGAASGLRVSRVRGGTDELLTTAITLGNAPWSFRDYLVEMELESNRFRLWIDGTLELDYQSVEAFSPGRFGFYARAQQGVEFRDWRRMVPEAARTGTDAPFHQAMDFNTFESFHTTDTSTLGSCDWVVAANGLQVDQNVNCRSTVLVSPQDLNYGDVSTIMQFTSDNDVAGLAFGFAPGEGGALDEDYLIAAWRNEPGSNRPTGFKLWRVRGPNARLSLTNPDVEFLASATTLGAIAWSEDRDYYLRAEVEPQRFRLWVDGQLEFDVATTAEDTFPDGRFGIYQNAQQGLRFRHFERWGLDAAYEGDTAPDIAFPFADPGSLDTHDATVDWADGAGPLVVTLTQGSGIGSGQLPLHAFLDDTFANGQICVTDDEGDSACERLPIAVRNVPPVTDAGLPLNSYLDVPVALDGAAFTDLGVLDTHVASIDWGDGTISDGAVTETGGQGEVDGSHAYQTDGEFIVTVCVADDDGGVGCDTTTVIIVPGVPVLEVRKVDSVLLDADGDGRVDAGDHLHYSLEVVNVGEGPATNVVLFDAVPENTLLLLGGETSSQGLVSVAADNRSFEVAIGSMPPQSTVNVGFDVQIIDPIPLRVYEVANQAVVSSHELDDVLSDDPDTAEPSDPTRTPLAQAGETNFCELETFDGSGPVDSSWTLTNLGDADDGAAEVLNGALRLTSDGSSLYHDDDHGAFLHRSLEGDLRVEVDIASLALDGGGTYRKACLMLRSSLAIDAARVMVCYVPDDPRGPALYFDARATDGGTPAELASSVIDVALPLRVALTRRDDVITASYLTSTGDWQAPLGGSGNNVQVGLGASALVGTMVSAYDVAPSLAVDFDNWRQCRPNDEEGSGGGTPPACDDAPLDVIYLLDFSQSMDADFPGAEPGTDASKLGAAKLSLERLQQQLLARGDGSRAGLVTFYGASDVNTNLAGAAQIRAPLTTDLGSVADALADLDSSDRPGLTTTPTSLAIEEVEQVIADSHDPSHRLALVLVTDGIPNIDFAGRGHHQYLLDEIQTIELRDGNGDFLPWHQVAWQGGYNGAYDTFDGEPLANAMFTLDHLATTFPDLMIYGIGIQGDGIDLGTFNLDLVDYAAHVSGGMSFGPATHDGLRQAMDTLLLDLFCGADGTSLLGGSLWNDLDADGSIEDATEPRLPGVTIEALDDIGTVLDSVVTAEDGSYLLVGLPAGTITVRVDVTTLPAGLDQATWDADGIATLHQTTLTTAGDEVHVDLDFGYRASPVGALPSAPVSACIQDPFDDADGDGLPVSDWTLSTLGDADVGDALINTGKLELSSNGSALWSDDNAHYLHRDAPAGDFRFEARLDDFVIDPGGNRFRKAGVMARADNGIRAPRVMAQVVPDHETPTGPAILFGVRPNEGDAGSALSVEVTDATVPVRLALERRGSTYGALYSFDDGLTWQRQTAGSQGGFVDLDLGLSPTIGLAVASYDTLAPMTVGFDDVTLCEPANVAAWTTSTASCDAAKPLDVTLILDASGSMSTAFPGALNRLDGAKVAIEQLLIHLDDRADGSRVALVVDGGVAGGTTAVRVLAGLGTPDEVSEALSLIDSSALPSDSPSSVSAQQQAINLLATANDPNRQPLVLWITDGPPSFDLADRGPYSSEAVPDDLDITDGLGGYQTWPTVGWSGPHLGAIDTFAGQPWADVMTTVDGGRGLVPGLRVHSLTLDGDGTNGPVLGHQLADFVAWLTAGSHHRAGDATGLATAMDAAWGAMVCGES